MKKRNVGIDILKIVCMFMILFMHYSSKESIMTNKYNPSPINSTLLIVANCICCVAVNCYFMITGYYSIKKNQKISKVFKLWGIVVAYSLIIFVIILISKKEYINSYTISKSLFPIITEQYWFITDYIAMILISPIIQVLLRKLTKLQYKYLLIIMLAVFSIIGNISVCATTLVNIGGINFVTMLTVYIIGSYIGKYHDYKLEKNGKYLCYYLIITIFEYIYYNVCTYLAGKINVFQTYAVKATSYNSIFVIMAATFLFLYFKNINIKSNSVSKIIAKIQSFTLAVYLIHENVFLKTITINAIQYQESSMFIIYIIGMCIIIYFLCCAIDEIRRLIFKMFSNSLPVKYIENKLNALDIKIDNIFNREENKIDIVDKVYSKKC